MGDGFRFIFTHSVISFVMVAMASGMFAVRCFGTLLSVYVRDVLQSNAALFGTLNSLIGFGMIAGTQSVRRFAPRISPQHMVIYGLAGMGAAVFVTALFGMIWSTAAGMLGLGFFAAFVFVTSQTLMQQETPQEMLGRVSQQPDVPDGDLPGAGHVRRRPGGAEGRHPQSVLRQRRNAARHLRHRSALAAQTARRGCRRLSAQFGK